MTKTKAGVKITMYENIDAADCGRTENLWISAKNKWNTGDVQLTDGTLSKAQREAAKPFLTIISFQSGL